MAWPRRTFRGVGYQSKVSGPTGMRQTKRLYVVGSGTKAGDVHSNKIVAWDGWNYQTLGTVFPEGVSKPLYACAAAGDYLYVDGAASYYGGFNKPMFDGRTYQWLETDPANELQFDFATMCRWHNGVVGSQGSSGSDKIYFSFAGGHSTPGLWHKLPDLPSYGLGGYSTNVNRLKVIDGQLYALCDTGDNDTRWPSVVRWVPASNVTPWVGAWEDVFEGHDPVATRGRGVFDLVKWVYDAVTQAWTWIVATDDERYYGEYRWRYVARRWHDGAAFQWRALKGTTADDKWRNTSLDQQSRCLVVHRGDLYIGGDFRRNHAGTVDLWGVARYVWDADTLSPVGGGFENQTWPPSIFDLVEYEDGIVAAGEIIAEQALLHDCRGIGWWQEPMARWNNLRGGMENWENPGGDPIPDRYTIRAVGLSGGHERIVASA